MPLFTSSKILPLNMLYVETVSSIMFDVSCLTVPTNISNLSIKANEKHNHETRFSSSCNFYINRSRLNQNHGSFAMFNLYFTYLYISSLFIYLFIYLFVIYYWLLYLLSPPASTSTCYLRLEMDFM